MPRQHRIEPHTQTRSKDLRRDATYPEVTLWNALRSRQVSGLKFRRQHAIESFVADFYCAEAKLVIEVDGESHEGRQTYDRQRQATIESLGYAVFRVSNDEVLENLDGVLEAIAKEARKRIDSIQDHSIKNEQQ